jgi:hypothetical protein
MNVVRFPLPIFHLNEHVNNMWRNRRKHFEMLERSPTTSTRRLSIYIGVSRTRACRTLHDDGLYTVHPQRVQNLHPVPCV